jgi:cysteine-rich repeat protein
MPRFSIVFTTLVVFAMAAMRPGDASALTACTAANIQSLSGGSCPPGNGAPCTINLVFDVASGCVLDFGTRAVTIGGAGELHLTGAGTVTLRAGSLIVAPSGLINGRASTAAVPNATSITIQTSGDVAVQKSGSLIGKIDVSGDALAGVIEIDAGGSITIGGKLQGDALTNAGAGGTVILNAINDITTLALSSISALGGQSADGEVDLSAGDRVNLADTINVNGDAGGTVNISAGADAVVADMTANGQGAPGPGGDITIEAGTGVQLVKTIHADAASAIDGGESGGTVTVSADWGDLVIVNDVTAEGAGIDGSGGSITLSALGAIQIQSAALVSVRANAAGDGGDLVIGAPINVIGPIAKSITILGHLDVSGGTSGGSADIDSSGDIIVAGRIDADGRSAGSFGGAVNVTAGDDGQGSATVSNTIDVGGGVCSLADGCGEAGDTFLEGCNVTVATTGHLLARSEEKGGTNNLTAHELLTVSGEVNARRTGSTATGSDGTNTFKFPTRRLPVIGGTVVPVAASLQLATCTGPNQGQGDTCLDPCPVCGNGAVEWPESCDNNVGTPLSCDGCSATCRFESCDDSNPCTADTCGPQLGCRNAPVPDGTACPDGSVCNGAETCIEGACNGGTPLNCNDNNTCTKDMCDPVTGCVVPHPPEPSGTPCSDNNLCTLNDTCNGSGTCTPGAPLVCMDGRECTIDTCNPQTGCVFSNRPGACMDDGNPCTGDVCSSGTCTHPAGNEGASCEDGLFCTVSDTCHNGVCRNGPANTCTDGALCTTDVCDEGARQCVHNVVSPCCGNGLQEAGEECDDGNADNTDGCLATCKLAGCGDGFVRTGVEQCDLGNANSNTPDATCRLDCTSRRCGDGIIDVAHGEQCDDHNAASGDGCSSRCFIEPPSSAQLIPGGGFARTDCPLEFLIDHPTLDVRGRPASRQVCHHGDPTCDFGSQPNECRFHLWLCANNNDPRLPTCTPGGVLTVTSVDVLKPSPADAAKAVENAQNRTQLGQGSGTFSGATPQCGPLVSLRVPVKPSLRSRSTPVRLRARTTSRKTDVDSLKLLCVP